MSEYENSDSDYQPPPLRITGLEEQSEDEWEILNGPDLTKMNNEDEDEKLAETIVNGVPEYGDFKQKVTDFETKLIRERTLKVN